MKQYIVGLLTAALMVTTASPLAAHEDFRVIGTVAKLASNQIDVKQLKDGKVIEIGIDKQTKITKDKKPMTLNDVKVGGSVVVDAYGDSLLDLLALDIRLVPAIPQTPK